jgi:hypothetical protein
MVARLTKALHISARRCNRFPANAVIPTRLHPIWPARAPFPPSRAIAEVTEVTQSISVNRET